MTRVPGLDLKRSKAVSVADLGRYAARRAPIVLLDARTRERQPIWAELDEQASGDEVTLLIHPARNLRDGQRYIVALRNLSDSAGRTLRPGAAFRAIRDGRAATGPLAARARQLEPSLRTLDAAGIGRSSLYLAWDFTVASTRNLTGRMLAIRDDAFAQLGDRDLADLKVRGRPPAFTIDAVQSLAPAATTAARTATARAGSSAAGSPRWRPTTRARCSACPG